MAPAKDKWVRRFIIPETTRHKKGFTIYKVTSVVFLKSSHEEISKVSVWKRYNDFKKLHSELHVIYSRSQIKENYPAFSKSKYFGRFEAEVIGERRAAALKFLEFIGRHSNLYSSDVFIKFFETSHADHSLSDCSQSLGSDTSEDDHHMYSNIVSKDKVNSCSVLAPKHREGADFKSERLCDTKDLRHLKSKCITVDKTIDSNESNKTSRLDKISHTLSDDETHVGNNNCHKAIRDTTEKRNSVDMQILTSDIKSNKNCIHTTTVHDGSDLPQSCPDSSQYILVAAAHMSAGSRHEAIAEYEEAFTHYKMGISSLLNGVQSDTDTVRAETIKEKISKYLERAEKLYNRHLNCNISLLSKPVSELQFYKVLKIIRSVMLVKDVRQDCFRIVKAIEKTCNNQESISNYILRGQVPYMVCLHACVETDTTVFLILEHLSRGKLSDFITSRYKRNDNRTYGIANNTSYFENTFDHNEVVLKESHIKEIVEYPENCTEKSEFFSTSPKVQTEDYPLNIDVNLEKYNRDVSTTQLVEKAQMLLQSVNETLKKSNSVANRLNETKDLIACNNNNNNNNNNNTASLNVKNNSNDIENWNIVLTSVNDYPNETGSITKTESHKNGNVPIRSMPETAVAGVKSGILNNDKNIANQYITDIPSLNNNFTYLTLCKNNSEKYSTYDSKDTYSHDAEKFTNNVQTRRDIEIYKLHGSKNTGSQIDECVIADNGIPYIDTELYKDPTKNTDVEEELWFIPENIIRMWAAEILLALEALHQQDVIVFDLKPDKILVDDDGHIKLTYVIPHRDTDLSQHKHPYASPELCMFLPTVPLTHATDIWSFGIILYELLAGNKFETRHPGLFHSHSLINIPNKVPENAKSLLLNILKYEPSERITIPEIKQHPFFDEIDWSSLVNSEV